MAKRRSQRARGLSWLGAAAAPWAASLGLLAILSTDVGDGARIGPAGRIALSRGAGLTGPARNLPRAGGFVRLASADGGLDLAAVWSPLRAPDGFVPVPDLGRGIGQDDDASGLADEDASAAVSDGATPAVPRAVALSSVTPAPAEAVPVEVAASTLALPGFTPRFDRGAVPEATPELAQRYAGLIAPDAMEREQRCLAEAVYFEARSEPEEGQAAVAQVVLNRVKSGLYPASVCGVVYQNRHRYMGCQFSFACEGKALRITDAASWASATRVAEAVVAGRTYLSEVGGATHYHADYVRPGWSRRLRKMDVIGRHIFYQLKRGQT